MPPRLTNLQRQVCEQFYQDPSNSGFLLAGGAALVLAGLVDRETDDLDYFTRPGAASVTDGLRSLYGIAANKGWHVEELHSSDEFVRVLISDGEHRTTVDLAVDSPPLKAPAMTVAGPTYAHEELAGRKVLALFGRAEARDLFDVYHLSQRFGMDHLMLTAAQIDPGFDRSVLADMVTRTTRLEDSTIPGPANEVQAIRAWAADLVNDLRS